MEKKLLFCLLLIGSFIYGQNNDCSGAVVLNVGTNFATNVITSSNVGASVDGTLPSCNSDAIDNVWFSVIVPASGNITIETREISTSSFDDSTLSIYSGSCGSLTEIGCDDDGGQGLFSLLSLTGQTPGATLYISVWKYDSSTNSGEFQISAYQPTIPNNNNCSGAIAMPIAADFDSGAILSNNSLTSTDGSLPSCNPDATDNIWFSVVVPPSGNVTIETKEVSTSSFDDSSLSIYSGICGSLTEIACDDDGGEGLFSLISLSGQTPGATLYVSVWKYDSSISSGEFQIAAYDSSTLSTHELSDNKMKIRISPNPFSDFINISDISEVKSISIMDPSGRVLKFIEKISSSIYLGDLKEGLYFVTLKMNDGTMKTLKIIKKL